MKNSAARKLKQVPKGYLVMGVDPHKKRHAAATRFDEAFNNRYNKRENEAVEKIH